MRQEAEAHAEEDKKLREKVELQNRCDARVYETEKLMKEHKDIISGDQKTETRRGHREGQGRAQARRFRRDEERRGEIDRGVARAFRRTSTRRRARKSGRGRSAAPVRQRARSGAGSGARRSGGKEGDVVDADFEMVDDDKKK